MTVDAYPSGEIGLRVKRGDGLGLDGNRKRHVDCPGLPRVKKALLGGRQQTLTHIDIIQIQLVKNLVKNDADTAVVGHTHLQDHLALLPLSVPGDRGKADRKSLRGRVLHRHTFKFEFARTERFLQLRRRASAQGKQHDGK